MEVQENISTKDQNSSVTKNSPEGKSRDIGVVILNIFLALVTIALLGYIAHKNGYIDLDNLLNIKDKQEEEVVEITDSNEQVAREDSEDALLTLDTYEGIYFNAVVPQGWDVVEYFDGDGTNMMDSGTTYTGLTGIQILKEGVEIMKIEGVSGIGFESCQELPRFADSSAEYEAIQQELNNEVDMEEIRYLDFTNTLFSEFQWLEKRFRRIGDALYYDTIDDDEHFQPQCEVSFFRLEPFGFEDVDGYVGDAYMYTISQSATEEELEILDKILISMVAN